MKVFLNNKFQIERVEDKLEDALVKGSTKFDLLSVYIPTELKESFSSIAPMYSVKRADGRTLGPYGTLANEEMFEQDLSVDGYYGWAGYFNPRDLGVKGALEITIAFIINDTTIKTVATTTTNVINAVEVTDDVYVIGDNQVVTSLVESVRNLLVNSLTMANDVVQDYAALTSYPTTDLPDGFRVLVMNDSNNDNNPVLYQWNGTTWQNKGYFDWTGYLDTKFDSYKETLDDYIDERLDAQDQTIAGLGQLKPSGTDTSTNILAFTEDKGIYIGTDTGYWYYWDATDEEYKAGGTYQATEIADGSVERIKLSNQVLEELNQTSNNALTDLYDIGDKKINQYWNFTNKRYENATGYKAIELKCKNGDLFVVGGNSYEQVYKLWLFLDDELNTISYFNVSNAHYDNQIIYAPEGATKLIVSGDTTLGDVYAFQILGNDYKYLTTTYNDIYWNFTSNSLNNLNGYKTIRIDFTGQPTFRVKGNSYLTAYKTWVFYDKDMNKLTYCEDVNPIHFDKIIVAPEGAKTLFVTGDYENVGVVECEVYKYGKINEYFNSRLNNIKISESKWKNKKVVWFGTSIPEGAVNGKTYPQLIADEKGFTLYNESLGSSAIRKGVNDSPLECKIKALSPTYAEKQNESWYDSLSDAQKIIARDSSCDYKFDKYLTGGSVGQVDLYVFDHAYNDVIPNNHNDLLIDPQNEYDKSYFYGGASFLINRILTDNPRAKIIWIGHYENVLNDETSTQNRGLVVSQAQETICEKYGIPLCKVWEKTGWSNIHKITTEGHFVNGVWVNTGGTSRQEYVKNCQFPDGIHPFTDLSGESNQLIADIISHFMETL